MIRIQEIFTRNGRVGSKKWINNNLPELFHILHIFSEISDRAYYTAYYPEAFEDNVEVAFVTSKSYIVLLKKAVTIPLIKLQSAVLAARLY